MLEYVDYSRYVTLYGEIPMPIFNRLLRKATQIIDRQTTGVDGYAKLKNAYPVNIGDVDAVQYCICELINTLYREEKTLEMLEKASGYTQRADGMIQPNKISSVSSGSESISFATSAATADTSVTDTAKLKQNHNDIVVECLRGVQDANGVNLLYMGEYPNVRKDNHAI